MSEGTFTDVVPAEWVVSDSIIKVMGVGGGGCNAVENMYRNKIQGCSFVVCNTDSQALDKCTVPIKIQMGKGLGAGTDPVKGRNAALEAQDEIASVLDDHTQMLFLTAGMGGGTGTGAAPVIAKMAKSKGILTVAVVTIPFSNEGDKAMTRAIDGLNELEKNVDSLLIINNEKLYDVFSDMLIQDAFPKADEVLSTAVVSIIEIIKKDGYMNVDFEDVKTMMQNSGMALMGTGVGSGENRIEDALKAAFESPLLNDFDLKTAKNVLINVTAGRNEKGLTMTQYGEINKLIEEYTGGANNFKHGLIWEDDPEIGDTIRITAIATGFKFAKLIPPNSKNSNLIVISRDFVYDRNAEAMNEGIPLQEDNTSHIGYNTLENSARLRIDPDVLPAMLAAQGDEISEMENTPAIRRIKK